MFKLFSVILLLLLIVSGCAQSPQTVYHFNLADDTTPFSKADADSCTIILKNRLVNAGYKNSLVSYEPSQRQFTVKVVKKGNDDFIKNGLVNQCEIYFTEMYLFTELSQEWINQPVIRDSIVKYLVISPNDRPDYHTANVGTILIKDTANFTALVHSLKDDLPIDCFFTYEMAIDPDMKGMMQVFACKKNDHAIYVNKCLRTARQDFDAGGRCCVKFEFTPYGADRFARMTRLNIAKPIGILVNDKICSAPFVNGEVTGGNAEISGSFTILEAQEIAANLSSGNLPVKLLLEK